MASQGARAAVPQIALPYPHPGQQAVLTGRRRFNWLSAGRRWRKTTLAMSLCVEAAVQGAHLIWGAPTFDQVRVAWDETRRAAAGSKRVVFNQTRMTALFPRGGAILFRSLDDPDNARGHTADGVVVDECADVKPEAWYEVLRPMLIDTDGWAWLIGTPKGLNWFWTEHQAAGARPDSVAWSAPSLGVAVTPDHGLARVPHPLENPELPFEEIRDLWRTMPERAFRQEVLGEFVATEGAVFRRVTDAAVLEPQAPQAGHTYVVGVDWGRYQDFSCFSVLDATTREQVRLDRFNQLDWGIQYARLQALCDAYRPALLVAERNAMGDPAASALRALGLPVWDFVTTNATKAAAVQGLALALERGDVRLLRDETQTGELLAFAAERLPSGMLRYGAPEGQGQHDDCVVALCLAWVGCEKDPDRPRVRSYGYAGQPPPPSPFRTWRGPGVDPFSSPSGDDPSGDDPSGDDPSGDDPSGALVASTQRAAPKKPDSPSNPYKER